MISTHERPAPRVAQRRRRADHRRHAARDASRTRSSGARTRSSSSTSRPSRSETASRAATCTRPSGSTPRSANYFRPGNLTALRELALAVARGPGRRGARRVPRGPRHRGAVGDAGARPRRADRVARTASGCVRRAARVAQRATRRPRRRARDPAGRPRRLRQPSCSNGSTSSSTELGGTYHEVVGADVGAALLEAARTLNATQIVMGASRRSRWQRAHARLGDRTGSSASRAPESTSTSSAIRTDARRTRSSSHGPGARPTAAAQTRPARVRHRRCRAPAPHVAPRAPPRRGRAAERDAPLPAARRRRLGGRRPLAGAGRGDRRVPARQLVLRPAALHVHDRGRREHPRAHRSSSPSR